MDYKAFPILYVDDESANLTAFLYVMADEFDVITATNAQDALNIMASRRVAVLLADQRMPGMTGSQLCARVRELYPDTARMIVSAYADMNAAVDAINSGQVNRYILKPWREPELTALLRSGLEAFHLGQLVRTLQVRLLDSQQQAGAHLVVSRMLHELANPTQALSGLIQLLADDSRALKELVDRKGDPTSLVNDLVEISQDAREAVRGLVSRLERFRRGDPPPDTRRGDGVELARAVTSAVAIVRNEIQKRARLEIITESDVGAVAMDPTHASQVLVNLLMNAHEAMDPARLATNRVEVRMRRNGDKAVMEVTDTGNGIEADKLPFIFDDFFSTKTTPQAGRGLGLAIVRDLVQAVGGTVTVRSEVGKGTTFTVEIPVARPL